MDPDSIPTEPIIDPGPLDATDVAPGPSQASGSPTAGRGRGAAIRRAAIGLVLALTFTVGIGVGRLAPAADGGAGNATPNPTGRPSSAQELALIGEAWDILHQQYVGKDQLDDQALAYGAIDGLTQAVGDTGHTSFLTPEERAARADELSGSYVGIGVRIDTAPDGFPVVDKVFKGSPAEKAGLKTGDELTEVDGKNTAGHSLDDVAGWVRGEAGTTVRIEVRSGPTGIEHEVSIVRAAVAEVVVSWTLVPGSKTAFLRLDQFSNGSADDVKAALGEIKAAGADRLILDLRGNPGGYVNEAVGVASQFLSSGDVYIERDAAGHETHHPVSAGGVATELPLVVLVDAGTASSAEIVSGALQDAGRAEIVGVKTYGTGTVLGEFPLADGSALRVGTVEWLTPKGRRIWHEGIVPDVIVDRKADVVPLGPDDIQAMTAAQVAAMTDPQLKRALTVATASTPPA
ncbi:MAG TPA: S41 family peptidase [Candidatus Limnocylindrales bacterium]|jgi:carboxyl-terminal processing protease